LDIAKADGTAVIFSYTGVDPTAVLPSGFIYWRIRASILREGGAVVGFIQNGDWFWRKVPSRYINTSNPGTGPVLAVLKVPLGIKVVANIALELRNATRGNPLRTERQLNEASHRHTTPRRRTVVGMP
jgi:hypothetical protein